MNNRNLLAVALQNQATTVLDFNIETILEVERVIINLGELEAF